MNVDVAVVGNGVIGMMIACRLRLLGAGEVAVIGPPSRPNGASTAAAAMLGCLSEVTKDSFASEAGRTRFELSWRAHQMWPQLLDELSEIDRTTGPLNPTTTNTFVLLNGSGGELDSLNFEAIARAAANQNAEWEFVEPSTIAGYNPRPSGRALRAIRLGNEGAVDSGELIRRLEVWMRNAGVVPVRDVARQLITSDDRVSGVELEDGRAVNADIVIVAAGAASTQLVRRSSSQHSVLPVLSGLGIALVGNRTIGEGIKDVLRTPNRGGACGLHVVPLGAQREYIGATNRLVARPAGSPNLASLRSLSDQAMHQVDEQIAWHDLVEVRAGSRPVSLDGFPLIGWAETPGLYMVTGTYRDGLTAAPALAEIVSDDILGNGPAFDISLFSPTRRPIETCGIDAAVEEYALHLASSTFELGGTLPRETSTRALFDSFRAEARHVYASTGISISLPPEIIGFLAHTPDLSHTAPIIRYLLGL